MNAFKNHFGALYFFFLMPLRMRKSNSWKSNKHRESNTKNKTSKKINKKNQVKRLGATTITFAMLKEQ